MLDVYEARRQQDRERLDAMMHYAQSPQCRMRLLSEYFDQPFEKDCLHCDNCHAHAEGRAAAGLDIPLRHDQSAER